MFDNMFEAFTPYEAERLLKDDPREFERQYKNMRRALQRRAKTLEAHGREYTKGYQKIKSALVVADGKDRAKSYALISSAAVSQQTKYSYQIAQEKKLLATLTAEGLLKGDAFNRKKKKKTKEEKEKEEKARRLFFKLLTEAHRIKSTELYYLTNKDDFWEKIEDLSTREGMTFETAIQELLDYVTEQQEGVEE